MRRRGAHAREGGRGQGAGRAGSGQSRGQDRWGVSRCGGGQQQDASPSGNWCLRSVTCDDVEIIATAYYWAYRHLLAGEGNASHPDLWMCFACSWLRIFLHLEHDQAYDAYSIHKQVRIPPFFAPVSDEIPSYAMTGLGQA